MDLYHSSLLFLVKKSDYRDSTDFLESRVFMMVVASVASVDQNSCYFFKNMHVGNVSYRINNSLDLSVFSSLVLITFCPFCAPKMIVLIVTYKILIWTSVLLDEWTWKMSLWITDLKYQTLIFFWYVTSFHYQNQRDTWQTSTVHDYQSQTRSLKHSFM